MSSAMTVTHADDQNASSRFVITMNIDPSGHVLVRSCEVINKMFRNRTSFGENATLDDAFCPQFAQAIRECVSKLSMEREMMALPHHIIEIPKLMLMNVRLVASKLKDGAINLMMRFGSFIGSINAAFRQDIGLDCQISSEVSVLSVDVLSDVVTPLLDICSAAEDGTPGMFGQLGEFGRKIAERSLELRFQAEMLKRFIQQQEAANTSGLPETKSLPVMPNP